MKILKFDKFLEEKELNLDELGKPIEDERRGDVLIRKINNRDDITLNNNKSIKVDKMKSGDEWIEPEIAIKNNLTDDSGSYDIDKAKAYLTKSNRYVPVFMDEDGQEWKINQLKKTKEFGSKGAGSFTRDFESVQCVFLGIKQAEPKRMLTSRNFEDIFNEYLNYESLVFLPEKIELNKEILLQFSEDPDWISTFCRIPNRLWKDRYVDINQLYLIYHASSPDVNSPYISIEKKYKQFSKSGGWSDINISKYCPADLYLVAKLETLRVKKLIEETNNIDELTHTLNNLFDLKLLIPISLKKIKDKFKVIVNSEKDKELPYFRIKYFHINPVEPDLKGIGSKISTVSKWKHKNNKDVDTKERRINFDSSDTSKDINVDGEVEGSSSRHGKISFTAIKRIIDEKINKGFDIQKLQTFSELEKLTIPELKKEIKNLFNKINSLKNIKGGKLIQVDPQKRARDISTNENRLISRLQSMQIVYAILSLYNIDENESNDAITKIMRYALSIQSDQFSTPRYLRII